MTKNRQRNKSKPPLVSLAAAIRKFSSLHVLFRGRIGKIYSESDVSNSSAHDKTHSDAVPSSITHSEFRESAINTHEGSMTKESSIEQA